MEDKENILHALPSALLPWYAANCRELPWRRDTAPYHIWLSEIMLQQTRVEAVKGYYLRFLQALPSIEALANADDELLHKLWEGLGYYSRARNLKKAAQIIVEKYDGKFPEDYNAVIKLPGIGAYTAGAICSIAFEQPVPAVDGNVLRVFTRLTNDPTPIDLPVLKKTAGESLQRIYPPQAGAFTQALMELGATVCGPNRKPDCDRCPCREFCLARACGTQEDLPVRVAKKDRRTEDRTVFILSCNGRYALQKRPDTGLLAGLWQFPNTPGHLELPEIMHAVEKMDLSPRDIFRQVEKKHIFTHIQWNMRGVYLEVQNPNEAFVWLTAEQIQKEAALPTAFRQFWTETAEF